jgi:hypothetical protein
MPAGSTAMPIIGAPGIITNAGRERFAIGMMR